MSLMKSQLWKDMIKIENTLHGERILMPVNVLQIVDQKLVYIRKIVGNLATASQHQ